MGKIVMQTNHSKYQIIIILNKCVVVVPKLNEKQSGFANDLKHYLGSILTNKVQVFLCVF